MPMPLSRAPEAWLRLLCGARCRAAPLLILILLAPGAVAGQQAAAPSSQTEGTDPATMQDILQRIEAQQQTIDQQSRDLESLERQLEDLRAQLLPAFGGYAAYDHWWLSSTRRYSGNVIWEPIPRVEFISEFLFGVRVNRDGHSLRAGQIQIGGTFRF